MAVPEGRLALVHVPSAQLEPDRRERRFRGHARRDVVLMTWQHRVSEEVAIGSA